MVSFFFVLRMCIRRHHTQPDSMRRGRINLLTKQPWSHLLMLFITLLPGVLQGEHVIQATLGGRATFSFNVTENIKITQTELNRCTHGKVLVFSPEYGHNIQDNSYKGRFSPLSNHSLVLDKIQESDFGMYCYKLTTFPTGSLGGKIKLMRETKPKDPSSSPVIMIISSTCGISLVVFGIIAGVVWHKKNRQRPNSTPTQREQEEEIDGNYLKVI